MSLPARPTLHVLAGPNGAGKTTLYDTKIAQFTPGVEFVNADRLAHQHFGHPALTQTESEIGQKLAESRRSELMIGHQSLVTELTFSHASKVRLIEDAKAAGYRVILYHINVGDAELAVRRVERRVMEGGHPVPEERIRKRYVRNQSLIRQAILIADRAFIFDNSRLDQPHRRIMTFVHGRLTEVTEPVPVWASALYAEELSGWNPVRR